MKNALSWMFVVGCLFWAGCGEDPNLVNCEGGECDTQQQCVTECEDVCGDPDYGSYDCIEGRCICQCFFGCR